MLRQARILLVDDRIENLIALDAILSSLNQILVPVQSGEQALQALLEGRLEAVEETATALRRLPAVSRDAEAAEAAGELARRVGLLRDALDAPDGGRG